MKQTIPYQLSKDYNRLFELVKSGNRIICFVDYGTKRFDGTPIRDVCTITNTNYEASARGIGYFGFMDNEWPEDKLRKKFEENCVQSNLEWVIQDNEPLHSRVQQLISDVEAEQVRYPKMKTSDVVRMLNHILSLIKST